MIGYSSISLMIGPPRPPKPLSTRTKTPMKKQSVVNTSSPNILEFTSNKISEEKLKIFPDVYLMDQEIVSLMNGLDSETTPPLLLKSEKFHTMDQTHKLKLMYQKMKLVMLLNIHSDIGSDSTSESQNTSQSIPLETTS
jgi:hypothetical protein